MERIQRYTAACISASREARCISMKTPTPTKSSSIAVRTNSHFVRDFIPTAILEPLACPTPALENREAGARLAPSGACVKTHFRTTISSSSTRQDASSVNCERSFFRSPTFHTDSPVLRRLVHLEFLVRAIHPTCPSSFRCTRYTGLGGFRH